MSSTSRITDDEMRYYQFKARQKFLIKKEDHDWNEFCKKNKCSCFSCQPLNTHVPQKDVGIQVTPRPDANIRIPATSKSAPNVRIPVTSTAATNFQVQATQNRATKFNQNTSVKRVQERPLSKSLNDMKTELEKLKFAVADIQLNHTKDGKEIIQNTAVENKINKNESALNLLSEQRKNLIRASLLNSLQRLHSSAAQKITKPVSLPSPKNKGFFLPPNLEKQRLIARNAYLSSLINKPKIKGKVNTKPLENKVKMSTERNKKQPQNTISNTRRIKVALNVKSKEEKTLIETEASTDKDENIENVVDGIVEDLLGEEILALNRIKHLKLEKQNPNLREVKNDVSAGTSKKDIHISQPSPETCAKIKQIPFFDLIYRNPESLLNKAQQSHLVDSGDQNATTNCSRTMNSKNLFDKHVSFQTPPTSDKEAQTDIDKPVLSKPLRTLHTDQNLVKKVTRQRKLYFQYLERISRNKSHNFDPIALSNMVAESLLNDCISDICKELDDVPTSLVAYLYKQEFTSVL